MNPQWITALLVAAGLGGQVLWTLVNLRIENRILDRIDGLKAWADARFVRRPDVPILAVPQHFPAETGRNLA